MSGIYIFFLAVGAPLLLWMVFVGDADAGDGFSLEADGDGSMAVLPLSAIAAFMATFGGIGLIGDLTGAGFTMTLVLALVLSLGAGYASRQLFRLAGGSGASSTMTAGELEGKIATVSLPITEEYRGKIVLEIIGAREQMTAAPADGSSIAVGEQVVIVRIERGVALVAPLGPQISLE